MLKNTPLVLIMTILEVLVEAPEEHDSHPVDTDYN